MEKHYSLDKNPPWKEPWGLSYAPLVLFVSVWLICLLVFKSKAFEFPLLLYYLPLFSIIVAICIFIDNYNSIKKLYIKDKVIFTNLVKSRHGKKNMLWKNSFPWFGNQSVISLPVGDIVKISFVEDVYYFKIALVLGLKSHRSSAWLWDFDKFSIQTIIEFIRDLKELNPDIQLDETVSKWLDEKYPEYQYHERITNRRIYPTNWYIQNKIRLIKAKIQQRE